MKSSELAIVGDIGATNMRLGVARLDSETGRARLLTKPEEAPTPRDQGEFFRQLAHGLRNLIEEYPDIRDGAIGFPGPVLDSDDGRMVGPITNISSLHDPFNLSERLADVTPSLTEIRMTALNDAEAATYAAPFVPGVTDPQNKKPLLYITHSTGVGGEVIQNHQIGSRLTGQLAEYGHVPILQPDGTYRTLERSISGPNMEKLYGNGLSIFELGTTEGDEIDEIWKKVGRDFGHGLGMMLPAVGPSDIVIGGGISRDHHRYDEALRAELDKVLAVMPQGILEAPTISYVPKSEVSTFGLVGARYAIEQYRR